MKKRLILWSKRDGMTGSRFSSDYAKLLLSNGFSVSKELINGNEYHVVDVNNLEEYIKLVDMFISEGFVAYISAEIHDFRLLVIKDKVDNEI